MDMAKDLQQQSDIAIIGAGPGGLLLARMLFMKGIAFRIFEKDASSSARGQGGTLDLHPETGQDALRRAGLFDDFLALARYEGEEMRVYDKHGTLMSQKPATEGNRPEIDRADLREILFRAIPRETIHWHHRLETITALDRGGFELQFAGKGVERFGWVVGADGAWSKVRPLVSAAVPWYTGSTLYELSIEDIDVRHPGLARFIGHGTALSESEGKAIILQRNSNGNVRVYAAVAQERHDGGEEQQGPTTVTKDAIAAQFAGWSDKVLAFVEAAGDSIRPWPIYALPVGHRWEQRSGVTLLGDAAHLMPPAGEGANLALCDAADLADAIASGGDRTPAIRAYEMKMFARGQAAAERSMAMMSGSIEFNPVMDRRT